MTEPGEVLDYLDLTDLWLFELEAFDSGAGSPRLEEPVQVLLSEVWHLEGSFGLDSLV